MKKDPLSKPSGFLVRFTQSEWTRRNHLWSRLNETSTSWYQSTAGEWIETEAATAPTAANAARFYVEQVVLRHGAPTRVLTDQETHFTATSEENVTKILETEYLTTTAYNSQCNGLTGRTNKSSAIAMSHFFSSGHKYWDLYVSFLTFALSKSVEDTREFSISELVYGREQNLPKDVSLGFGKPELTYDVGSYATQLSKWVNEAREIATKRVNVASKRRAYAFNAKQIQEDHSPGDHVLLWSPPEIHATDVSKQYTDLTWNFYIFGKDHLKLRVTFGAELLDLTSASVEENAHICLRSLFMRFKRYPEQLTDEEITTTPSEED